jgi:amino acid adenylation domain-containing protein
LVAGFLKSAERYPARTALVVGGQAITYEKLHDHSGRIASTIRAVDAHGGGLVALLAHRSLAAYSGVLGILRAGKGYVPLNPKFPAERTRRMLELSGAKILIVGEECYSELSELLPGLPLDWLTVILPEARHATEFARRFPTQRFVAISQEAETGKGSSERIEDPGALAYLLFTSGSTGVPKGVPIPQSNVRAYVEYIGERYQVSCEDRFSQEFDLTFDLSAHDLFVSWEYGASLYSVPEKYVLMPAKFIRDNQLTMWFSVPSVAVLMDRMRLLEPGSFPSLRFSLFCGEPLPARSAERWQAAAPGSMVENLYGPTEATIAISHYRWNPEKSPGECVNGIVPLGEIFANSFGCLMKPQELKFCLGDTGELCLGGPQVTTGYWKNAEKTRQQFVHLGDRLWYRTGDLVGRSENGCHYYLGRLDHQVKIRGFRVELQEVEMVLRQACGTEHAVCVPRGARDGLAEGIVAFISGSPQISDAQLRAACEATLPEYMVPGEFRWIDEMPLNANGKVDRGKLMEKLKGA